MDGIKYLYEAGGPIAKGMGNFYPTNVTFPTGNPDTNPSDVGGAAWWWAQGTNPVSPYYDPSLHSCLSVTCTFPIVGELGAPGLDTSISEWITSIEGITNDHVVPYTFDLNFGGPGSLIGDQLVQAPGTGPLPVWNLGWAADNFDPQDYVLPMEFPNSTYTLSDAVEEQLTGTQFDNSISCGHSLVTLVLEPGLLVPPDPRPRLARVWRGTWRTTGTSRQRTSRTSRSGLWTTTWSCTS